MYDTAHTHSWAKNKIGEATLTRSGAKINYFYNIFEQAELKAPREPAD